MKIYISGKINGDHPEKVRDEFLKAENLLRQKGCNDIVNPSRFQDCTSPEWDKFHAHCMAELETCQGIYMLDNWRESFNSRRELTRAMEKRLKIMFGPEDL